MKATGPGWRRWMPSVAGRPGRLPGLRIQMLLACTAVVLVVVLACAAAAVWFFVDRQQAAQRSRMLAVADALSIQLERIVALEIRLQDLEGFDKQCDEALDRHAGLSFAMVTDPSGRALFRSRPAQGPMPMLQTAALDAAPPVVLRTLDGLDEVVQSPVHALDGSVLATVSVGYPLEGVVGERNRLLGSIGVAAVATWLLASVLLWVSLSRLLLRPLGHVVQAVSRVRDGDRQATLLPREARSGELAVLAEGFNALVQTVTLRERELLDARDAAERANQAKSQFLALMSHELRTPLNAVLGMSEVLARTPLDARQQRLLAPIVSSARLLAGIINDLLDLSTIEAGRLNVAVLPFHLVDVITEGVERFRTEADRRGLWLTLEIDPALPERVMGDSLRVQQVLGNLLSNALKFTERGGVRVTVSPSGQAVRLAVADTGIGIEPEFLPHVYEAFQQADGSFSRRFSGTGLGLNIARSLCDAMGGRIDVASRPGRGTSFWFEWPLHEPAGLPVPAADGGAAAAEPADGGLAGGGLASAPAPAGRTEILLVEDSTTDRAFIQQVLAGPSWQVIEARDGTEGLARLYDRRYDLLLLDWQLPGIDGGELLQSLRALEARESWPRTPVIVITAQASEARNEACAKAGVDAVLVKPVTAQQLGAAVEAALQAATSAPVAHAHADADADAEALAPAGTTRLPLA